MGMELADSAKNVALIPKKSSQRNGIRTVMKEKGCWGDFSSTLSEQFQLDNIHLNHYPVEDFYRSQWQKGDKSIWYLLYRWCISVFYIVAGILCAIQFFDNWRFFVYLTDWGFMLCMIATTYGAVLTTLWYFDKVDAIEQGWGVKIFWIIHWSALVLSTVITVMFWTLLLNVNPAFAGNPYNILLHATNSIVMVIDLFVVAFPSRILHFIYPLTIGIVYGVFTVIYYFAGGTGLFDMPYIYPILDWGNAPGQACVSVVIAIACSVIFSFLFFWLYKLRVYLYETFSNAAKPHTIHY